MKAMCFHVQNRLKKAAHWGPVTRKSGRYIVLGPRPEDRGIQRRMRSHV
jgi:hypothetical protein